MLHVPLMGAFTLTPTLRCTQEFNRVIQRTLDGKITKDEQLSSEMEDASYDYYRCVEGGTLGGYFDD